MSTPLASGAQIEHNAIPGPYPYAQRVPHETAHTRVPHRRPNRRALNPEERALFRLKPNFGGAGKAVHQRIIKKIYGREAGLEVLQAMQDTPALALPVVLVAYALLAPFRVPTAVLLFALGFVGFAATPPLQLRVMRFAGDAPTMASAANIAAFNLGNAVGSAIGGATIAVGLGWVSPVWVGLAMAVVGGLLVFGNRHEAA